MKLSEVKIQARIFQWHWNNYPQERGLLCYNLNNSANKVQGSQNKAIGLIKGRSDMVYYFNSLVCTSIYSSNITRYIFL